MIKSNALFIVIVIALIVGILSASLVLVSFRYKLYFRQFASRQKLDLNASSGMNLLLADFDSGKEGKVLDLYGVENDSVLIKKVRWGIFDIGIAKAFDHQMQSVRIFQIGNEPKGMTKSAIYLVDDGNSLAVTGNTNINGTCYLPERGVRGAEVSGFHFSGNRFINGEVRKSLRKLPEISREPIDKVIELMESSADALRGTYSTRYDESSDSIFVSFLSTPLLIYAKGPLEVNKKMSGFILLKSDTLVTVKRDAKLEDVMILAPEIVIEEGFRGNIQAFATDTLVIGEKCELKYPSVLGVIKNDFDRYQPSIVVGKDSFCHGFIFSYQRVEDMRRTLISIQPGAEVIGQIYSDGYLELKGKVTGGIMCRRFILHTPASIYENHLLHASIDNVRLSPYYLMPPMLETKRQKNIVKWLR
jgi:hypothetical protein